MAKYHINPKTGAFGKCHAKQGNCPFGDSDHHFNSEGECNEYTDGLYTNDVDPATMIKNGSRAYVRGALDKAKKEYKEFVADNEKEYNKFLELQDKKDIIKDKLKYESFETDEIFTNSLDESVELEVSLEKADGYNKYKITESSYNSLSDEEKNKVDDILFKYNKQIENIYDQSQIVDRIANDNDFSELDKVDDEVFKKYVGNLQKNKSYQKFAEKEKDLRKRLERVQEVSDYLKKNAE